MKRRKSLKKTRIFVDMDGTLAVYNPMATAEDYKSEGYFLKLGVYWSVLNAVKILINKGYDIYIISAVYKDSNAEADKLTWLKKYLPELWHYRNPNKHIIFTPCGDNKLNYIKNPKKTDILLDDYSVNLVKWTKGISVKVVNGLNWTNGSWSGYSVDMRSNAETIANTIRGIAAISLMDVA